MKLRPYQEEAKNSVLKEWQNGNRKTLLVLPTGTGKTVVFSKVAEEQVNNGGRVLILAHRGELLEQASNKLKDACNLETVLEKADSSALGSDISITVGSVQSMAREERLSKFPNDYYSDIIIDEAHHCLSASYQRVLDHFPNANILGVTATPDRGDQRNLGKFFDSKAYEYSITSAIKDGYLCPVKAQMIPLKLDIGNISISNGDYSAGEIGDALNPYLYQIAKSMVKYCKNRKTVVFLPLIKTSLDFCKILNENGFNAVEVDGNSQDRAEILSDFEKGKYNVLCNSMLLTEGWDCPSVDCVVILRPTKVRSLYQQMVGRGMRLSPNKENLLLLDFLWLTHKHNLCRASSLISKDENVKLKVDEILSKDDQEYDLLDVAEKAEKNAIVEREESLANELSLMKNRKAKLVDPIQYALSISAEDLANYTPSFAWEMAPPTQGQLEMLERRGILPETVENCGMATLLIDKLINRQLAGLSTPKQIRLLERYGFYHVGEWTFDTANKVISRLSERNWKLPYGFNPAKYRP